MKKHFFKSLVLLLVLGLTSCEPQESDVNLQENKADVFDINPETGKKRYNVQRTHIGSQFNSLPKENNRSAKSNSGLYYKGETLNSSWKDLSRSILQNMEDETGGKGFYNLDFQKNRFTYAAENSFNPKRSRVFFGLKAHDRPKSIFINNIRFGAKSSVNRFYNNTNNIKFRALGKIDKILEVKNGSYSRASGRVYSKLNNTKKTQQLSFKGEWNFNETKSKSVSVSNKIKSEFEAGGKLFQKLDIKVKVSHEISTTNTEATSTSIGFRISTDGEKVKTPPGKRAYWAIVKRTRTENYIWKGKFDFSGSLVGDHGKSKGGTERHYRLSADDFFYEYTNRGDMEIPTSVDYDEYTLETWYE